MNNLYFTLFGIAFGSVLGFLFSWCNSIIIIKKQEAMRVKREFRNSMVKLIVKIMQNEYPKTTKLWETIQNYYPISDVAIYNVSLYLNKPDRISITNAYNHYKNPNPTSNSNAYDIVEDEAKKLAISKIKEILKIVT